MFRKVIFEVFFFKVLRAKTRAEDTTPDISSVSYKHIRAHETVLDLVCRLLLEKKKKKKKRKILIKQMVRKMTRWQDHK